MEKNTNLRFTEYDLMGRNPDHNAVCLNSSSMNGVSLYEWQFPPGAKPIPFSLAMTSSLYQSPGLPQTLQEDDEDRERLNPYDTT